MWWMSISQQTFNPPLNTVAKLIIHNKTPKITTMDISSLWTYLSLWLLDGVCLLKVDRSDFSGCRWCSSSSLLSKCKASSVGVSTHRSDIFLKPTIVIWEIWPNKNPMDWPGRSNPVALGTFTFSVSWMGIDGQGKVNAGHWWTLVFLGHRLGSSSTHSEFGLVKCFGPRLGIWKLQSLLATEITSCCSKTILIDLHVSVNAIINKYNAPAPFILGHSFQDGTGWNLGIWLFGLFFVLALNWLGGRFACMVGRSEKWIVKLK